MPTIDELREQLKNLEPKYAFWALNKLYKEHPNLRSEIFKRLQEISLIDTYPEYKQKKFITQYMTCQNSTCQMCGKIIPQKQKYCSHECRDKDPNVQKLKEQTSLKKYGTKHPNASKEVQEKRKKTCLEKYGVESYSQTQEYKDKYEKTCLERYGFKTNLMNEDQKKKIRQTNLERYGNEVPSKTEAVKEKAEQTNLERYGAKSFTSTEEGKQMVRKTLYKKYGVDNPQKSKEIKEKTKQTNLKRYGSENVFQNKDVQEKQRKTLQERYGVDNISQLPKTQEKIRQTSLEKYGVEHFLSSDEVQEKRIETNLERYDVESPLQNSEIYERYRQTMLERYGYEYNFKKENYYDELKTKNLKKYGYEYTIQVPEIREKGRQTSLEKYGTLNTSQRNIKHFKNYNGDYIKKHFIVDGFYDPHLVSEYFGISRQCAKINKELWGIKEPTKFYNGKSIAENELFESINVENKIHNDRNLINPYELDIVLPDYKIAIEYNGIYWHSDKFRDENYHLNKTLMCKNKGYRLFHIFEFENLEIWKSIINDKLGLNKKIDANDCIISEASEDLANYFCTQNSLQPYADSTAILGLYHDSKLMQIMSFKRKDDSYIISNFCTEKGYHIDKGTDKLFKYFLEHYKTESVIAYADIRYSDGSEYANLGFKQIDQTEPNVYSINDFIMFDCGNLVYEFKNL